MKYLKMIGLAAVAAMALTAFFGVGSASATLLCKTELTTTCAASGQDYGGGQEIHAVLQVNKHATLNATWTDVTCKTSTVGGKVSGTAKTGDPTTGNVETLTFGECSCAGGAIGTAHTVTLETGSLSVAHINGSDNGTLTGSNQKVTVNCTSLGTQCIFGTKAEGAHLGELKGGNPATITANATVNHFTGTNDEGSFLCGSTAKWEGSYEITSPKPLYVSHH